MNARPALLADLVGTSLHRVPRNAADHREEARRVLSQFTGLIDAVLVRAQMAIAPIPPPPAGREFPGEPA